MDGVVNFFWSATEIARDLVFAVVVLLAFAAYAREGPGGILRGSARAVKSLPGVKWIISRVLRGQVRGFLKQVDPATFSGGAKKSLAIPKKGVSQKLLLQELEKRKKVEIDPHTGKIFAYVYTSEDKRFETVEKAYDLFEFDKREVSKENESKAEIIRVFFHAFMHENALNPLVFPTLRQFETETVAMVASMLHGDGNVVGSITSGGTESILMAMKTYRDRARALFPQITKPEVVAPRTIHPAFEKAASYFDLCIVHVPLHQDTFRVDLQAYKKAITPNTILLLGSATEYCYGMVDPIGELSDVAMEIGLPLHVDSCIGGFMLPWVEKLGYPVPVFDFRLPGVTSMSADIHKYGLGAKGSSVVLYRNAEIRKFQIFAYAEWPGGLFGSPSMAGTRPGGNIASSWAVLQCMGQDGYMDVARRLMAVTKVMTEGVNSIEGLFVCGEPSMTIFSIGSRDPKINVFALADVMETKGWKIERQLATLHCTILPSHDTDSAHKFVDNLRAACEVVKSSPALSKQGSAGVYGMVGVIPDKAIVKDFLVQFFSEIYTL